MPAEPLPLKRPFAKCPLCRASIERCALHQTADISRHPLYSTALPTQLRWLHCADCNHIFTQDFWTEAGEKLVFASTLPHQMPGTQSGEPLRAIWAPTVARVASLLCLTRPRESVFGTTGTSRPRWVDIGFGNGALVATADEFGFDALGIDVRPAAVEALANAGYKAAQVSFSDLVLDAPVAVLSFCDALEHMQDPIAALRKARDLLDGDGLLYLSLPNSETMTWRQWEAQGTNPYWGELEHYHNFSRTRLIELLDAEGFAAIDYYVSSRYYSCMELTARKQR